MEDKVNVLTMPLKGNIDVRNPYKTEQDIYDELNAVVDKYAGRVSYVAMLGVIELIKQSVIDNQSNLSGD